MRSKSYEPIKCTYTLKEDEDRGEYIESECCEFEDNEPLMESWKYCPYCGLEIKFDWQKDD